MQPTTSSSTGAAAAPTETTVPPPPPPVAGAQSSSTDFVYSCRKCRHPLFRHAEIVPHDTAHDAKGNKRFQGGTKSNADTRTTMGECTSYFLDPDVTPWVARESREINAASSSNVVVEPDTIYCVKCRTKVGAQHWVGSQCSCGAWITPAFQIHAKAIDKMRVAV